MRNAWTIAKREFVHYFVSPIAYAVGFLILGILGLLFFINVDLSSQQSAFGGGGAQASMDYVFSPLLTLLLFFVPVLTMRLLSEEQNKGTLELILTAPVREWELVLGKWLGAWFFGLCLVGSTGIYALVLYAYGKPDPGPIGTGFLGMALVAGALLAIGVFASSLSGNLIVSIAVGLAFSLFIWIIGYAAQALQGLASGVGGGPAAAAITVLKYIDFSGHFQDTFGRGIISSTDLVYFLSVIVISLFFATRIIETRRWQ